MVTPTHSATTHMPASWLPREKRMVNNIVVGLHYDMANNARDGCQHHCLLPFCRHYVTSRRAGRRTAIVTATMFDVHRQPPQQFGSVITKMPLFPAHVTRATIINILTLARRAAITVTTGWLRCYGETLIAAYYATATRAGEQERRFGYYQRRH